jgi:hypothetical protein
MVLSVGGEDRQRRLSPSHPSDPPARRGLRFSYRCATYLVLALSVVVLTGCASATHREVGDSGDVVVRSGPTAIGWAMVGFGIVIGAVALVGCFVWLPAGIVSTFRDEAREAHRSKTGLASIVQ